MAFKHGSLLFSHLLFLFISISCRAADESRQVYIVYMGSLPQSLHYSPSAHHFSLLQEVVDSKYVANSLVRSYMKSFNGFAANLTTAEVQNLAGRNEVISVFPSTTLQLHTTRSWDFMGFHENATREKTQESDVIVGMFDSGIWPESESFNDEGFGPPPKKWKGVCKGGWDFTCNNKVIGARYYSSEGPRIRSARDNMGHGSHTASTAAGNSVKRASFFGLAEGTARGAVPSARIAVYKVCDPNGCQSVDVLAAFDDAISDGVDIISASFGSSSAVNLESDVVAIGAFHAMARGVLTVQSAGNIGCQFGRVPSTTPWIFTIAASSTDRKFIDKIVLGNGKTFTGNSINSFKLNGTNFPIVYGQGVSSHCSAFNSETCAAGCLDAKLVKGKIVVCQAAQDQITEAYKAGALGAVAFRAFEDTSFVFPLPAVALSINDLFSVKDYANMTENAHANILPSETIQNSTAPVPASFSACGPNPLFLEIMKPDVTAPGIDILAAYSPLASPTTDPFDKRQAMYNIMSGTSMSCPHATGVAAYVKSFHPDWSPSAIKSAIMTTALPMNASSSFEFAYGSGHINPVEAIRPGLVFDMDENDYINFLCRLGLDMASIRRITGENSTCSGVADRKAPLTDFNYPSITLPVSPMVAFIYKFQRTVTNVGSGNSTYMAKVTPSPNITVEVEPNVLSFKSSYEKKSFGVSVIGHGIPDRKIVSTSFVWSDGVHNVRVPITAFGMNLDY